MRLKRFILTIFSAAETDETDFGSCFHDGWGAARNNGARILKTGAAFAYRDTISSIAECTTVETRFAGRQPSICGALYALISAHKMQHRVTERLEDVPARFQRGEQFGCKTRLVQYDATV